MSHYICRCSLGSHSCLFTPTMSTNTTHDHVYNLFFVLHLSKTIQQGRSKLFKDAWSCGSEHVTARGVWGHAPIEKLDARKLFLKPFLSLSILCVVLVKQNFSTCYTSTLQGNDRRLLKLSTHSSYRDCFLPMFLDKQGSDSLNNHMQTDLVTLQTCACQKKKYWPPSCQEWTLSEQKWL